MDGRLVSPGQDNSAVAIYLDFPGPHFGFPGQNNPALLEDKPLLSKSPALLIHLQFKDGWPDTMMDITMVIRTRAKPLLFTLEDPWFPGFKDLGDGLGVRNLRGENAQGECQQDYDQK